MKRIMMICLLLVGCLEVLSFGKPMESATNYNVMLLHGAYGSKKGFAEDGALDEAFNYGENLASGATLGGYNNNDRLTKWLSNKIFEEPDIGDGRNATNSYVYHWRSFSNPANSSINNARELGDRTWNSSKKFGRRRALVEEAQEVKAKVVVDPKNPSKDLHGQVALDSIRKDPNLYRQLASRYILIGHSMGGVVSREYVQNSKYYYGDVDKVVTLDSPHEGTGALNMQLDLTNLSRTMLEGLTESVSMMSAVAIGMWIAGKDPGTLTIGGIGLATSMFLAAGNLIDGAALKTIFLEDYDKSDSLVCYVDPHYDENTNCKGVFKDENITALKSLQNTPDSLPMFRLMAGKNSLTFTDPKYGVNGLFSIFLPDALTVPFENLALQLTNGMPLSFDSFTGFRKSFSTDYVNAVTGFISGLAAGVHLHEQGSALVETKGGLGYNTKMLTNPNVDVKRFEFNAAYYASTAAVSYVLDILLAAGVASLIVDCFPVWGTAVKTGLAIAAAAGINGSIATDTTIFPYLMEDFLYEKPFVNLLMGDPATLAIYDNHPDTSLNKSCWYFGDDNQSDKGTTKCVVGLFGGLNGFTSVVSNISVNDLNPLTFHSEMDWSSVGMKVDRWEKVKGLDRSGNIVSNLVPIRHVERYELPKIVVSDFIEKYSFVVDDLMPHRLRQIRMNFNFQTEIAWECDIAKDSDAPDACVVYADKNASGNYV